MKKKENGICFVYDKKNDLGYHLEHWGYRVKIFGLFINAALMIVGIIISIRFAIGQNGDFSYLIFIFGSVVTAFTVIINVFFYNIISLMLYAKAQIVRNTGIAASSSKGDDN